MRPGLGGVSRFLERSVALPPQLQRSSPRSDRGSGASVASWRGALQLGREGSPPSTFAALTLTRYLPPWRAVRPGVLSYGWLRMWVAHAILDTAGPGGTPGGRLVERSSA